jgi:serine/threonine-protein kinase
MPIGNKLTDRYEIKQTLGQGGMGIVYWAYDTQIRRDVALKTIRDAPEKAALELFYKECNILASMSHPNIIEIFDIGKFEDEGAEKPYFVMPLLKGVTLDGLIRNSSRRLTVERTVEILCQTCRGLQAAHERGLVHRDLKPSNLFVLEDDSVKIIDFGVAHMADSHTASAAKGTLLYMAPEQIQLKPATALSDIFTLGVVAYEALTLRRPFDGATHRDIANAILHSIPPPASDLNPAVSPLVGRVVHKTRRRLCCAMRRTIFPAMSNWKNWPSW